MDTLDFVRISEVDSSAQLVADTQVFSLEVIRRAAFGLVEHNYLFLEWVDDAHLAVTISPKQVPTSAELLKRIVGELGNELLNQSLRDQLMADTRQLRELIVGRTLYAASGEAYQDIGFDLGFPEDDDFLDDPLGIAVPWEEKYGADDSSEPSSNDSSSAEKTE